MPTAKYQNILLSMWMRNGSANTKLRSCLSWKASIKSMLSMRSNGYASLFLYEHSNAATILFWPANEAMTYFLNMCWWQHDNKNEEYYAAVNTCKQTLINTT